MSDVSQLPAAGAVGVNAPRSGVEIWWDPGDYVGPVVIKAVNAENGDVGVMKDENDGLHMLTWPPGTYEDEISVYEDTGDGTVGVLIAQGAINVKVSPV